MDAFRPNLRGLSALVILTLLIQSAATPVLGTTPPANDDWTNFVDVPYGTLPFTHSVDTSGATDQVSEPQPCGSISNAVWYRVGIKNQAAGPGDFGAATHWSIDLNTSGSDFDTVVAVYDGDSSDPWPSPLDCHDDGGLGGITEFVFEVTPSSPSVVYVQVGGKAGATGNLVFNLSYLPSPANDHFADAEGISTADLPYSDAIASALMHGASRQSVGFRPEPCNYYIARSAWYTFTPTSDMDVVADTLGSDFDTGLIGFVAGSHEVGPDAIACNDDDGALVTSSLSLSLTANVTYYFEVGATYDRTNDPTGWMGYGNLVFRLSAVQSASVGAGGTFPVAPLDATPAQPLAASVTSPNAGTVSISVQQTNGTPPDGYSFLGQQFVITAPDATSAANPLVITFVIDATVLAAELLPGQTVSDIVIYRNGDEIDPCTAPGAVPDPCVASRTLLGNGDAQIVVRTTAASTWNFAMPLSSGPANDNWTDKVDIEYGDLPFTDSIDTSSATDQVGEPSPCGGIGNAVWYRLSLASGAAGGLPAPHHHHWTIDINTTGSDFDTVVAVYDGDSSDPWPSPLECHDDGGNGGITQFVFEATNAPEVVYVQVGGKAGATGNLVFNASYIPAPANDNYADAAVVSESDLPYSDSLDNHGASMQYLAFAQNVCEYTILRSVWYTFTPTSDMDVVADTVGSDFDTGLIAAVAGSHPGPEYFDCNDDDGALDTSSLSLSLTANVTYYFEVGATYDSAKPARVDYGNLVFRLSAVQSASVGAGGTFPVAPLDATPAQPLAASVTSPNAGTVSISVQQTNGTPPDGYSFLGQQFVITAPDATSAANPLVITFVIDATVLAAELLPGQTVSDIVIYRNGDEIDPCTAPGAVPDPCVASRTLLGNGDAQIVVRTTAASTWNFATPTAVASIYQPDGLIRRAPMGRWFGGDLYNADAAGQFISPTVHRARWVLFRVRIQNDGDTPDAFSVEATDPTLGAGVADSSSPGYKIRYLDHGTNITAAILAGTWETSTLDVGEWHEIKIKVRVTRGALPWSSLIRLLTITSLGDAGAIDSVSFGVIRGGA